MDDLQRIAQALADSTGRAIAIDDAQNNLLCHTAHDDRVDAHRIASVMRMRAPDEVIAHALSHGIATATGPVHVPASPELELLPRLCVPVRNQGLLFGYLWIIEPEDGLPTEDVEAAVEAAAQAGEALYREKLVDDLRDSRERELLRDLLSDDEAVSHAAVDVLVEEELLPQECAVAVLVVHVHDGEGMRTALSAVLRRAGRHAAPLASLSLARAGGRGLLLLAGRRTPTPDVLNAVAERVRDELQKHGAGPGQVRIGIGPAVPSARDAASSARRARQALEVAEKVASFSDITSWSELGAYRLLVQLPLDSLAEDAVPEGLARLLEHDSEGTLVQTLETWLDEGADSRETTARLQVHRTSLYYRLGRIEEITGLPLGNGSVRLDLHLGLKLARLQGRLSR